MRIRLGKVRERWIQGNGGFDQHPWPRSEFSKGMYCTKRNALGGVIMVSKTGMWATWMEGHQWRVENQNDSAKRVLLYCYKKTYKQDIYACIHHQQTYHRNGGKDVLNLNISTYAFETKIYLWTYNMFMISKVKTILNFPRNHKLKIYLVCGGIPSSSSSNGRGERGTISNIFLIYYMLPTMQWKESNTEA